MTRSHMLYAVCTSALIAATQVHAQDSMKADVIHWWTSESEAKSIAIIANAFNAAGGEWVDAAVAGTDAAKAAAATRLQAGDPPAAVVYNSVRDIEDLVANGLMINLDDVAAEQGWQAVLPAAIWQAVTRDGHVYGAPINLGVNNYLWSSKAALEKIGMTEPPKTWDEFFAAGDKLKEAGIVPFAQSGMWYWYLLTFGNVLATQNVDMYNRFHALDATVLTEPEFKKAVEIFARLREYSDEGVAGREWNLSNGMVMRGEAAFQLMGDWAKGEIIAGGMVPGKDVLCTVGLNASPVSISGDIFAFPVTEGDAKLAAQKLLAKTVMSPETQVAYATAKGSLPVRTDVKMPDLDICAEVALTVQAANSSVSGYPVLLSPDAAGSVADVLGAFWVDDAATADNLIVELQSAFASVQ